MYDVVVIGAGAAGCTAAEILAEHGFAVLVAERCDLPRYKSCSGVLIQKSIDLIKAYYQAEVPKSVMCAPLDQRGMVVTTDQNRVYRYEQTGLNVWRHDFDFWLLSHAVSRGAAVYEGTSVVNCEQSGNAVEVTLSGKHAGTIKARYVIDCGGATDSLNRRLTGSPKDNIITYQNFYEGTIDLDGRYFYAFLQSQLSEYDAWFNVKGGMLVLGVAVRDGKKARDYHARFLNYLRQTHGLRIEKQIKEEKWIMPHVRPDFKINYGLNRVLFAGECAGFLNPMGEGISAALESGFCAANAVLNNFGNEKAVLASYQNATLSLKEYMQSQWRLTANFSARFQDFKKYNF